MGSRFFALALLLAACGTPAVAPAPAPAPTTAPTTPPILDPTRCAYGLASPELPIVVDEPAFDYMSAAAVRGKVLVAYQRGRLDVNARLVDLDGAHRLSRVLEITPRGGQHGGAQVVAVNDKFFVAWQDHDAFAGRYVSADGALGPIVRLPGQPPRHWHLVWTHGHFVATWESDRPRRRGRPDALEEQMGCMLYAQGLDEDLKPLSAPNLVTERENCFNDYRVRVVGDEAWLLAVVDASKADDHDRVFIHRLGADGHALEAPIEVGEPKRYARTPDVVETPGGALVIWSRAIEHEGPQTMELDRQGRPRGPATSLVGEFDPVRPFSLESAGGRPVLLYEASRILPLGTSGAPAAVPLAPYTYQNEALWVATEGEPWLLWKDIRHAHDELYGAPLRCGGTIPGDKDGAPFVDTHASAPPPAVTSGCAKARQVNDLALTTRTGAPRALSIAPHGDEVWIGWEARIAGKEGFAGPLYVRRLRTKTGEPLGPAELVLPKARDSVLVVNGAQASVVYEDEGVIRSVRLGADRKADEGSRVALSPPLVEAAAPLALPRGDVFWRSPKYPFLQTRAPAGPVIDVQHPNTALTKYRVAERPDGFIAAWVERDTNTLVVTRSKNGALAWSARGPGFNSNPFEAHLPVVGVVGDQVLALADQHPVLLARFTLDGARLADVPLPFTAPIIDASISERGIAAVTRNGNNACLELVAFDGKRLSPPACTRVSADIEEQEEHWGAPRLQWIDGVLHWLYGTSELHLRRWSCD